MLAARVELTWGEDLPVVVLGEAWGTALAVRATLDLTDGPSGERPDALFLVDPMTTTDTIALDDPDVAGLGLLSARDLAAAARRSRSTRLPASTRPG